MAMMMKMPRTARGETDFEAAEGLAHFFLLALKGHVDAGIAIFQFREIAGRQFGEDFVGIGFLGIHTGTHRDPAHAVGPGDGRVAGSEADIGHGHERHLETAGGADAHLFKVREPAALVGRVANLDANVVAAALQPQGFITVIAGINLPGQILHGKAQGAGFRFQGRGASRSCPAKSRCGSGRRRQIAAVGSSGRRLRPE